MTTRGPLCGMHVLDFSTLLPGPLATLMLAEAGATVVKVERPGRGDEMRSYKPRLDGGSGNFVLLNRGKLSVCADLKNGTDRERVLALAATADVVVEQFRPGVMARLGLGYDTISDLNPHIIYCSISGYGQCSPIATRVGHDLNYMAESGTLGVVRDSTGSPTLQAVLVADIAGGAYPAVINILLALAQRHLTGRGSMLDISMRGNLDTLNYWAWGDRVAGGAWPAASAGLTVGGTARYQIYRTKDGRFIAAAPLEDRFWAAFCDAVGLPEAWRSPEQDQVQVVQFLQRIMVERTAEEWAAIFEGRDVCCTVVPNSAEAMEAQMGEQTRSVVSGRHVVPALPVPVVDELRTATERRGAPTLGQHDHVLVRGNWDEADSLLEV